MTPSAAIVFFIAHPVGDKINRTPWQNGNKAPSSFESSLGNPRCCESVYGSFRRSRENGSRIALPGRYRSRYFIE
jgi:hypothetical protein